MERSRLVLLPLLLLSTFSLTKSSSYSSSPGSIYSSLFYLNPADGEVFGPFEPSQLQQWIQEGYFTHDLPVSASPNGPFQPMQNDQKVQMHPRHQEHHYDPYLGNEMQQYERQQYQVQQYQDYLYPRIIIYMMYDIYMMVCEYR